MNKSLGQRRSAPLALEARVMFDAAAVATATATALAADPTAHTVPDVAAVTDDLGYVGTTSGLNTATWTNALGNTTDVTNSADGSRIYTLSTPAVTWGTTNTFLTAWTRGSDGKLTLLRANSSADLADLAGATQLALSEDGASLYVVSNTGVNAFSIDASTGAITRTAGLADTSLATLSLTGDLVVKGNTLVLSGVDDSGAGVLKTFTVGAGSVTNLASLAGSEATVLDNAGDLQLSADGSVLYVATTGTASKVSAFSVGSDGRLTYLGAYGGSGAAGEAHYSTDLALSSDGSSLYTIEYKAGTGSTITAFSVASDGRLSEVSTSTLTTQATDLTVSADGSSVFVTSTSAISVFSRASSGALSLSQTYTATSFGLLNMTNLGNIELSKDGSTVYISGQVQWAESMMTFKVQAKSTSYTEGSDGVSLLPGGLLRDDSTANGVLTIVRAAGASADDVYGFKDGNGLNLDVASGEVRTTAGVAIASFTQAGGTLTVRFSAQATTADSQAVLRQISYRNVSQAPDAAGANQNFTITFTDADAQSDSFSAAVKLVGVNDKPLLSSTAAGATFTEQGEAVRLFSGTRIDTVESGQQIWKVVLTLNSAGTNEVIVVGGEQISLTATPSGQQTTPGGLLYTIAKANGTTTLSLFMANTGRTLADVASLVDGLGYLNTGSGLSGSRSITLSVVEFVSPYGANETSATVSTSVSLAPPAQANTAPTLSGAADLAYTEQQAATALLGAVSVADAQMDALNGGRGNYDRATLTLTLGAGRSAADVLGFNAGDGYTLVGSSVRKDGVAIASWQVGDGVLTLRFSAAAGTVPTTADVNAVLQRISYSNTSDAPVAMVAVTVRLTDQVGLDSALVSQNVRITAVNDESSVGTDASLSLGHLVLDAAQLQISGLGDVSAAVASADGSYAWVSDGSGHIAVFAKDLSTGALSYERTLDVAAGVSSISKLVASTDGKFVYAVANGGDGLAVYATAADGSLTLSQLLVSGSSNEWQLQDMQDIALSSDGKNMYVLNGTYVVTYALDADTGLLSYVSQVGDAWSAPYMWQGSALAVAGDYVAAFSKWSPGSLIVWQRDGTGALTLVNYLRSGNADAAGATVSFSTASELAISSDGRSLYMVDGSGVRLFAVDPTARTITYRGLVVASSTVTDIQLSADASVLYVSDSSTGVSAYGTSGGALMLANTLSSADNAALADAQVIALDSDGRLLIVGDGVSSVHLQPASLPALMPSRQPVLFATLTTFSDPELELAGNYRGASLTLSSSAGSAASFGFADTPTMTLSEGQISLDGQVIATLEGSVLSFTADVSRATALAVMRQLTYTDSVIEASDRTLTVTFNDGSGSSVSHDIALTVQTRSNVDPAIGDLSIRLPDATGGQAYSFTLPDTLFTDADGDALVWSASGLPAGLSFDPATRTISGRPEVLGRVTFELTATDPLGASVSRSLALTIEAANRAPVAGDAAASLPMATTGAAYSVRLPAALFADADGDTLSWSASDLPPGLSFDAATHTVSGTPTATGAFSFTLTATDPDGASVSRSLTLSIEAPNRAPVAGSDAARLPAATTGTAYNVTLPDALFADADGDALSWSASSLPPGLSFDAATHTVSGTPTTTGSFSFTLTATDPDGASVSRSLTLDIAQANRAPVAGTVAAVLPAATAGTVYNVTLPDALFADADGDALRWSAGSLPPGLSFDAATHTVSGTPTTAGSFSLTLTATDPDGASVSRSLALQVAAAAPETPTVPATPTVPDTPTEPETPVDVPVTWTPTPTPAPAPMPPLADASDVVASLSLSSFLSTSGSGSADDAADDAQEAAQPGALAALAAADNAAPGARPSWALAREGLPSAPRALSSQVLMDRLQVVFEASSASRDDAAAQASDAPRIDAPTGEAPAAEAKPQLSQQLRGAATTHVTQEAQALLQRLSGLAPVLGQHG